MPGTNHSPADCLNLGPAAYTTRMSNLGVTFPLRLENGTAPDPTLTYVDFRYGEVTRENAKVYASLDDAIKNGDVVRRVDSPYSFISYSDEAVVDGKRYYMVDYGGWMTANDISRIGTPSLFQGKAFTNTPERSFGWITFPTETKRSPGFSIDDYTGREVSRYQEVQIYSTTEIDGIEWYMIGPDQWIPEKQDWQRLIGRVIPNTTPPEGVDNGQHFPIDKIMGRGMVHTLVVDHDIFHRDLLALRQRQGDEVLADIILFHEQRRSRKQVIGVADNLHRGIQLVGLQVGSNFP